MGLNYKRTALVGLAFLSICALWQLYDTVIPLILRDTFHIGDTAAGFIMSLDNILALVLLPLFGAWSDKKRFRMPFILAGTILAVVFLLLLPAAQQKGALPFFFAALGLLLISMGIYRSPAVALMPDVTPKPLRSKANAVINLMGALGGVFTLAVAAFLSPKDGSSNYFPLFLSVGALMLVSAIIMRCTINERKLAVYEPEEADKQENTVQSKLPAEVKRSLVLILFSVSLWYMGYNAVTTAFTKYATSVWGQNVGQASTCLMVATVGAVVSYIPIGSLSSKIGRKKTILIGVAVLAACFASMAFLGKTFHMGLFVVFLLVGFAWAAINVNSYPMVVEISRQSDLGKYTGYYYTFSMAAQVLTPILSGALLEHVGYHTLFPYAAIMAAAAFVTMSLTRHGDNKPQKLESKLEHFAVED